MVRTTALLVLSLAFANAARAEWALPATGYDLLRGLKSESEDVSTDAGLNAYAQGVAAQAFVLGMLRAGMVYGEYCAPQRAVKAPDVVLVVRVFLEQRPERLSEDPAKLVDYALAKAFPCG